VLEGCEHQQRRDDGERWPGMPESRHLLTYRWPQFTSP
jgi:hypothetical protein